MEGYGYKLVLSFCNISFLTVNVFHSSYVFYDASQLFGKNMTSAQSDAKKNSKKNNLPQLSQFLAVVLTP